MGHLLSSQSAFVGQTVQVCGLVVEQRIHNQVTGEPIRLVVKAVKREVEIAIVICDAHFSGERYFVAPQRVVGEPVPKRQRGIGPGSIVERTVDLRRLRGTLDGKLRPTEFLRRRVGSKQNYQHQRGRAISKAPAQLRPLAGV